jgi:hypothetical protein
MAKPNTSSAEALAALRALGYNAVPRARTSLRGQARHVNQVLQTAPGLAELSALARDGQARLKAIMPLLPTSLRGMVQSGGIEGDAWCLLVPHSAAAAKLRQMLPALAAHLRRKGWAVQQLRVKVQSGR